MKLEELNISTNEITQETRPCGKCKNFKLDYGANVLGTCKKKLMTVISNGCISYEKKNGTCFE